MKNKYHIKWVANKEIKESVIVSKDYSDALDTIIKLGISQKQIMFIKKLGK